MGEWLSTSMSTSTLMAAATQAATQAAASTQAMLSAPAPDEQAAAGSVLSAEESGTTTAQFTDPGPLGIQFDWKENASADVELTVDSLAVGSQAEKVGGLQPGMLVISIDGMQIRGLPQAEIMSALKQRPVTVAFGSTAAVQSRRAADGLKVKFAGLTQILPVDPAV